MSTQNIVSFIISTSQVLPLTNIPIFLSSLSPCLLSSPFLPSLPPCFLPSSLPSLLFLPPFLPPFLPSLPPCFLPSSLPSLLASLPYSISQRLNNEFIKWMDWYGKSYGEYELLKGDFLDPEFTEIFQSAS